MLPCIIQFLVRGTCCYQAVCGLSAAAVCPHRRVQHGRAYCAAPGHLRACAEVQRTRLCGARMPPCQKYGCMLKWAARKLGCMILA